MKRLLAITAMIVALGCNPSDPTPPAPLDAAGAMLDETGPHAAGKKVFNTSGCGRCHTVGSTTPPKKPGQGPDLAKVAGDPEHTPEWLADFIREPKSKKPASMMPRFQGKINDADFKALIEYLTSLK